MTAVADATLLDDRWAGRVFAGSGAASAVLILVGVLSPLDLPLVDTANLVGYVVWSVWLIAFGAVLALRHGRPVPGQAAIAEPTSARPLEALS